MNTYIISTHTSCFSLQNAHPYVTSQWFHKVGIIVHFTDEEAAVGCWGIVSNRLSREKAPIYSISQFP